MTILGIFIYLLQVFCAKFLTVLIFLFIVKEGCYIRNALTKGLNTHAFFIHGFANTFLSPFEVSIVGSLNCLIHALVSIPENPDIRLENALPHLWQSASYPYLSKRNIILLCKGEGMTVIAKPFYFADMTYLVNGAVILIFYCRRRGYSQCVSVERMYHHRHIWRIYLP